jgi:hypothetical protein
MTQGPPGGYAKAANNSVLINYPFTNKINEAPHLSGTTKNVTTNLHQMLLDTGKEIDRSNSELKISN